MHFSTDDELGDLLKEKETNFSLHFLDLGEFRKYRGFFLRISTYPQPLIFQNAYLLLCYAILKEGRDGKGWCFIVFVSLPARQ